MSRFSHRISFTIFAAGALIAAILWISWQDAADTASSSRDDDFSWLEFIPDQEDSSTDWEVVIRHGHLATFDQIRDELVGNTISDEAMAGFRFLYDKPTVEAVEPLFDKLDGPDRAQAIERIYAALMRAPSSQEVLIDKLQTRIEYAFANVEKNWDDNGRHIGWAVSINTYASLLAFKNTRNHRFLDVAAGALERSLRYRDSEIGRIDAFRGRAMHSWGGNRYVKDGRHSTNVTLAGRIAFVLALFAETVRNDERLEDEYGQLADRFLIAARLAIDEYSSEFETTADGTMGYYFRPTHENDIEPWNHMAWAGNALIILDEMTDHERYGRMAHQLARFFRHGMRMDDNGSLFWRYQPMRDDYFGRAVEWVWKARTTTQFIHFAWQRGVVFTDEDAKGVATMMRTNVFRPDGRISARIDAEFRDMEEFQGFRGNYLATTPFIVFDEASPHLGETIEDLVATRPDIGGWMYNRHGVIAYAHRLRDAPQSTFY